MPCKCSDLTTCHDPDSHEDPTPSYYPDTREEDRGDR
jgi:hypothetical protein